MTNEQINIAIAEACGWKIDQERKTHGFKPLTDGRRTYTELPDYCKDLNAIQEVVMTLPESKRILYGVRLAWECGHTDKKSVGLWHISTATAYHRAVAFLKVLEKWEE